MENKFDKIKKALTPDKPIEVNKDVLWNSIEEILDSKRKRRSAFILWLFPVIFILAISVLTLKFNFAHFTKLADITGKTEKIGFVMNIHCITDPKCEEELTSENKVPEILEFEAGSSANPAIQIATEKEGSNKKITENLKPISSRFSNDSEKLENQLKSELSKDKNKNVNKQENEIFQVFSDQLNIVDKSEPDGYSAAFELSVIETLTGIAPHQYSRSDRYLFPGLNLSELRVIKPFESKREWELHFTTGIYAIQKNSIANIPELVDIKMKRNNLESLKEGLTTSLVLRKELFKNIFIGTGIQYNILAEVVSGDDIKITTNQIDSDSAKYYTGISGVDYFSGQLNQTRRTGYKIYSPNYLHRWNIPLEISYKYRTGSLQLVPSFSLLYNLYQRYEGIHLGFNNEFIYKEQEKFRNIYRSSGLIGWSSAMDLEWSISDHMTLNFGLAFQQDLSSAMLNNIGLKEKYQQFGLRFGVIKQFKL